MTTTGPDVPDAAALLHPPLGGSEVEVLLGSLERMRRTFFWKCEGVDAAAMQVRLGPSAVSLGGLLKHMTRVEDVHWTWKLFGERPTPPWDSADLGVEWEDAKDDDPRDLEAGWVAAVHRSRALVDRALREGGLDLVTDLEWEGAHATLRNLLVDLVEEYGRHTGHADLVRESIDGRVGEDPPDDVRV